MARNWLSISSLAVAVVLFFAVNIFGSAALTQWRFDLTENDLYTLTEGTRNILADLDEPVTLRFFLSREAAGSVPAVASYARRVEDVLREYERYAGDNLNLEVMDPEPFSGEEDQAQRHGLRSIPVSDGGDPLYFGLVGTNTLDDTEVLSFFSPSRERLLEYDLTRLIHKLDQPERPVVGLVSSLPLKVPYRMARAGQQSWLIVDQMEKLFEVENIDPEQNSIADTVDVLMIAHPGRLSDGMLYAIDQFVLRGGRVLAFMDPYVEAAAGGRGPSGQGGSNLTRLLEQWGVELVDGKLAADMTFAERVQYQQDQRQVVGEFPVWLNVQSSQFNTGDVVTANLGSVFMATPGVLRPVDGAGTEFIPLIESSSRASMLDTSIIEQAISPASIIEAYEPGSEVLPLAARLSGRVESAFPEGRPESRAGGQAAGQDSATTDDEQPAEDAARHVKSSDDVNVIVVADADLLHEQFWAQRQNLFGSQIVVPNAGNADLVINALENLTGSNDLINVRSRGEFTRPFTKVSEIRQGAELRYRQKEQELLDRLQETEQALLELEQGGRGDGNRLVLTGEQQQEIEKFRNEKIRIREELRKVQHQLRSDIDALEGWVKFVNIGLLPLLIVLGAAAVSVKRTRRRTR